MRTIAVLDYVGGHFELEQSDMIFTRFLWTGPLDRQGKDYDRIRLLPRASSLARLIEQPLGSYIRSRLGDEKSAGDTDRSRCQDSLV